MHRSAHDPRTFSRPIDGLIQCTHPGVPVDSGDLLAMEAILRCKLLGIILAWLAVLYNCFIGALSLAFQNLNAPAAIIDSIFHLLQVAVHAFPLCLDGLVNIVVDKTSHWSGNASLVHVWLTALYQRACNLSPIYTHGPHQFNDGFGGDRGSFCCR